MAALVDRLTGIVHEPTQQRGPHRVDLTVDEIHRVTAPGRVDFGGDELAPAGTAPIPTTKRDAGDEYEWWELSTGQYLIGYNESLDGETPIRLQTRSAVLDRGAFHPTVRVEALDPLPFTVSPGGIRIKENARITTAQET